MRRLALGLLFVLALPAVVEAGMPAVGPMLTRFAQTRLQGMSFFAVCVLVAAVCVRQAWNTLALDLVSLPRISLKTALAATLLWGLLSIVVLTMISGARELMTPGAWVSQGMTYRLAEPRLEARPGPTPPELPDVATEAP